MQTWCQCECDGEALDYDFPLIEPHEVPDGTVILAQRGAQKCELCGVMEELRPYGPNKEYVCFDCGMLDEESAKKAFRDRQDGR